MIDQYLLALRKTPLDDHTEMTGRAALEALLNGMIATYGPKGAIVTHEAKHNKGNAPDFKITHNGQIIGYVETKAIGSNFLNPETAAQIKRYRALCPNVILTDYLRFDLYSEQHETVTVRLGETDLLTGKPHPANPDKASQVTSLLKRLLNEAPQGIGRARELAQALAVRAHMLRESLTETLVAQAEDGSGDELTGLYQAFKAQVSVDLTLQEFADAYAQTLAYGLFLAKLNAESTVVTLANAQQFIPAAVPLLRELVKFLSKLDDPAYADIRWVVDEVLSIVNGIKLSAIIEDLSFRNRKANRRDGKARSEEEWRLFSKDPFIYFYEDFLEKYDKATKKARGVYYTPPPVVSFIVRAVNDILKESFGITAGLADKDRVTLLDFACGTGTFLVEVMEQIFAEIGGVGSAKAQPMVAEHLLKNLYGFEYLVAPYTIAHLKLSQYLREAQLAIPDGQRFQVYLTNTVEPMAVQGNFLLPALSRETEAAQAIKEKPILVITGNPPYSGHSKNNGPVAKGSIAAYKTLVESDADGKERTVPLGEKNPKWLQDDYVKFIRFAQMKIDAVGEGVVAIITNHSFLDNPTFRGMRQSLMRSFDQIRIIDLHGNAKKKEVSPDGSNDENVFDIEQGVAISLFIKRAGIEKGVWRSDVWGKRQDKYEWAARTRLIELSTNELRPSSTQFLFVHRDDDAARLYEGEWGVQDIFPVNSVGLLTARDNLVLSFDQHEMITKLARFASLPPHVAKEEFKLADDVRDWRIEWAQADLLDQSNDRIKKVKISYRPFDKRWTSYTGKSRGIMCYPRHTVMSNMIKPNIALITARTNKSPDLDHFFVSDAMAEAKLGESTVQSYTFPLYLYPLAIEKRPTKKELQRNSAAVAEFEAIGHAPADSSAAIDRIENIAPAFRSWLDGRYGTQHSPEALLGYIYAVLHAPSYRRTNADFLRSDFPRIPFADSNADFLALSALGGALVDAHLLKAVPKRGLGALTGKAGSDGAKVDSFEWRETDGSVPINATQRFEKVPKPVWDFTIGGYQVIRHYLKARKGRVLSLDEMTNVENVVNVLAFTIDQMTAIDAAYLAAFPNDTGSGA